MHHPLVGVRCTESFEATSIWWPRFFGLGRPDGRNDREAVVLVAEDKRSASVRVSATEGVKVIADLGDRGGDKSGRMASNGGPSTYP